MQLVLTVTFSMSLLAAAAEPEAHWPSFRGPDARGQGSGEVPTAWNVESGDNVLWKTAIPGLGYSSPVVWGDRIFLTTAVSGKADPEVKVGLYGDIKPVEDDTVHSFRVLSLDRKTGKILWDRAAHQGVPRIKRHPKSTHANSTPATDGKHIVAFFGSEGLYCYDFQGNLLWKKDFGLLDSGYYVVPRAQWGFASSPIIHEGRVIIQVDVQKGSFLAALDVETGGEIWRVARDEVPTWSTPSIYSHDGGTRIAVNGYKHIGGYDFEDGSEIWRIKGGGDIPVPTPIVAEGLIYITNAHGRMAPIYAVRSSARGDITPTAEQTSNEGLAWSNLGRSGAYMQTPLVVGDYLYVCRDNGVLSAYRAATGEAVNPVRPPPRR